MSTGPEKSGSSLKEVGFLAKHSVVYGLGNMLSRVVAFLMLPIYTRHLSLFDYGVLEIVDTTTTMIGLVAGLGIGGAMARFYFEHAEEQARRRVVSTTLILMLVTAAAVIGVASFFTDVAARAMFDNEALGRCFRVALITLLLGLLIDLCQVYLRILLKSHIYVAISVSNLLLSVSLNIYFVVYAQQGVYGIFLASVIAKSIVAVPLLIMIARRVGLGFDMPLAKQMYRFSLPLIPTELASTAISYSDRYFINHFLSTAEAGIYGLAQKLGTVTHMLITSPFLLAYLPRRFEIARHSDAPRTFSTVFDFHMLALVVSTAGLALFAREMLVVMTTPEFYRAAVYIPAVGLSVVALATKYHFQFGMLYSKKTHYMMYANVASACVHVAMNFALISWLGLWGALIASVVAYSCNSVLSLYYARSLYYIPYNWSRFGALLAVGAIFAAAGSWSSGDLYRDVPIKLLVFAVFVPLALAVGISADERAQLANFLRSRFGRRPASKPGVS